MGEGELEAGKSEVVDCCLNKETCSEDGGSKQCVPRMEFKPSHIKLSHLCRLKAKVAAFLTFVGQSSAMASN